MGVAVDLKHYFPILIECFQKGQSLHGPEQRTELTTIMDVTTRDEGSTQSIGVLDRDTQYWIRITSA